MKGPAPPPYCSSPHHKLKKKIKIATEVMKNWKLWLYGPYVVMR